MANNEDDDALMRALFPEEWYKRVTNVINFAINQLQYSGSQAIALAKTIIDYNIEKRLEEALTGSAEQLLPRSLDWSKISEENAFRAFTSLLETCEVYPRLKRYLLKLKFGKNNLLYNSFLLWKETAANKFPKLRLRLLKTKVEGTFTLEIRKAKQSK